MKKAKQETVVKDNSIVEATAMQNKIDALVESYAKQIDDKKKNIANRVKAKKLIESITK